MNFVDIMLTIVMPFIIIFIINISISLKLTRFSFLERFKTNVTSPTTRATSKSPSHNHHHHRHNQRLSSWSSIRNYGLCTGSAATARSSVSSTEERINIVKGDEAKENNNNNKKQSLISSALAINTSSTPLPHQVCNQT